jgi:hypothetical protein
MEPKRPLRPIVSQIHWGQEWRIESLTIGTGTRVQTDTLRRYQAYASGGLSEPGPVFDLDRLVSEADIVAAGPIISIREQERTTVQVGHRTVPAKMMVGDLRVDRVLKGTTEASPHYLSFHFFVTDEFVGWRSITPASYQVSTALSGVIGDALDFACCILVHPCHQTVTKTFEASPRRSAWIRD